MSKVFFTSDPHFGHGNIIKYCDRPFLMEADKKALAENGGTWHTGSWKGRGSAEWRITREAVALMDTTLINNINATVGQNDTLWILGDFSFARDYQTIRAYRDRINCQFVNIVWGNHDRRDMIKDLFHRCYDLVSIEVPEQRARIVMCHYAMAVWDGSHRGNWLLYGHSHGGAEQWLDKHMPGRKSIDVGVDNAIKVIGEYRPFSLEELQRLLKGKLGYALDLQEMVDPATPKES